MATQHRDVLVQLPTRERLRLVVGVQATGRELFQQVCDKAGIREAHLFGLSVDDEYMFMDLEQKLSRYFSKDWSRDPQKGSGRAPAPFPAFLHVQYYVDDGRLVRDRTARRLYYWHLKERVLRSQCAHREEAYFLLAAYGLQADLGNHRARAHTGRYFEPQAYFPPWVVAKRGSAYLLRHTPALHREQRGLRPGEAVLRYIAEACRLDDVPVHLFQLYKDKKEDRPTVVLGLTLGGLRIYQEVGRTRELLYDLPWAHIGKLAFLGKKLEIRPHGLPSARKLVYHTGCASRSRHLLRLLSSSHQLHLALRPARGRLPAARERGYRETYISDTLEPDLRPASRGDSPGSGQCLPHRLSLLSADSHSSSRTSGMEPGEMSVDGPFGAKELPGEGASCSCGPSQCSGDTAGGSRGQPEGDAGDQGHACCPPEPSVVVRVTLVKMRGWSAEALHQIQEATSGRRDQHSRSLGDMRPQPVPRSAPTPRPRPSWRPVPAPRSCHLRAALDPGPPALRESRSMNSLSPDRLPEEFVV